MLDVDRKCMLNSLCVSLHERPAGVKRKPLCSFHFLDTFPDVSSQYIQMGKARTQWPLVSARQRLPAVGSVIAQGETVRVLGS